MSGWNDFVTAALLGTERNPQAPSIPEPIAEVLAAVQSLPKEESFLATAGTYATWRRAGHRPSECPMLVQSADAEEVPAVSTVSAAHLRQMLAGQFQSVLPEWLGAVMEANCRVPFELLPALLDRARQDSDLRPLIAGTGGKRGLWLAAQNPNWSFGVSDSPELWETGTREQRLMTLRAFRKQDPAEARNKLQAVWKDEPAGTRAAFLSEFHIGLSMEDEPFLEETLDDRSKEVRRVSVELLSRLPGSRLVERMTARATPLLQFKPGKLLSKASLEVTLPAEPDPAGLRDGLDPKAFGNQKALGERAVLLVLLLASVPPGHWSTIFGVKPAEILQSAEKSEFARALSAGWTLAAARFRDIEWAQALLDGKTRPESEVASESALYLLLPETARAERLIHEVRSGALVLTDNERWRQVGFHLDSFDGYWPEPLTREVLGALRRIAERGIPWHLRGSLERLLRHVPPSLGTKAAQGWPIDKEGVSALSDFLNFRHDALTAIRKS